MKHDRAAIGGFGAILLLGLETARRGGEIVTEGAAHGTTWFLWNLALIALAVLSALGVAALLMERSHGPQTAADIIRQILAPRRR